MESSETTDNRRLGGAILDTRRSPFARLRPVTLGSVHLEDEFWAPRIRQVSEVILPDQYAECERTGRIDNFRRASGRKSVDFQGRYYNDSDVYKWIEAASFALALESDSALAQTVDSLIAEIAAAQEPSGYLNTYFTFERVPERYTDLTTKHELYCAGHLLQAAVAHHRATGETTLLEVGTRLADQFVATFGPAGRAGTDGHEEVELALVELFRETGNRAYLDLAGFFLDQRGQRPPVLNGSPYLQDHQPVREQSEIVGHAVRATYLACGMTDVYAETGDASLLTAVGRLWASAFERKAYLTGGLGSRWQGEAFGADYELPNERAYAETCAAIGGLMWNWRMLQVTGEARFADWLETAIYNGILSGLSLDGKTYFYQNPLADSGRHRREPWFATACCPPNVARILTSLPGYFASASAEGLWLHLYARMRVRAELPGGGEIALRVETEYPWEGTIRLTLGEAPDTPHSLFLRIPSWCKGPTVTVNGSPGAAEPGAYAEIRRHWHAGDVVVLDLPMPVERIAGHPSVLADQGRVALRRGPFVYCVEAADNPTFDVFDLVIPPDASLTAEWAPGLLGGVVAIRGQGLVAEKAYSENELYRVVGRGTARTRVATFSAIPYYAWANREAGPMLVWIRTT